MKAPLIISASRRTDIPAFFGDWFMRSLRDGECLVPNPFNPHAVSQVSLRREDVSVFVFWSKNPKPFLRHLDDIEDMGFPYYFLFTLNRYPEAIEPHVPDINERIETFRALAERIGRARVIWRYDPIILSDRMSAEWHKNTFTELAAAISGCSERVIISFVDLYRKTERRLRVLEEKTAEAFSRDPFGQPDIHELVGCLKETAASHGMEIQSCAEDDRLRAMGIAPGKCIDDKLIERVFGISVPERKDAGQRKHCLCVRSRDVGTNGTCPHGCIYCYAARRGHY